MSEDLKTALRTLAQEDKRTLSSYIEMVLEKHASTAFAELGEHAVRLNVYRGQTRRFARGKKRDSE
jgi:hypothetical protein